MKSDKMSYILYADIEFLIKKVDGSGNNPENSSAAKIGEHIPCWYSMSTVWVFDHIEDKNTLYRGEDCKKAFCEPLSERTKNIIDFESLTKEELKLHQDARNYYIYEKRILKKLPNIKNYLKVRDHCHYTGKYRGTTNKI